MIYAGDFSEADKKLIEELKILEKWFVEHGQDLPIQLIAKGFTAMSHDFYALDLEEEGDRLLDIAHKHYPDYFKGPIYGHMANDKDYTALLANMMTISFARDKLTGFGFRYEN